MTNKFTKRKKMMMTMENNQMIINQVKNWMKYIIFLKKYLKNKKYYNRMTIKEIQKMTVMEKIVMKMMMFSQQMIVN
jgi:hypothetical protein